MWMFTKEERDAVRARVLEIARGDTRVMAGALTGSAAVGEEDGRSDIDVAFGIAEGVSLEAVLDDWTGVFDREWGVIHYWDLPSLSSIYRVFLLPNGLEIDVGLSLHQDFGARGPRFRTLFGTPSTVEQPIPPAPRYIIGLCWHHIFHARTGIERRKPWLAEYWITETRHQALALACLRHGHSTYHGRGTDLLPPAVTAPFDQAIFCSLAEEELRHALAPASSAFSGKLTAIDLTLSARLKPLLDEFGGTTTIEAA